MYMYIRQLREGPLKIVCSRSRLKKMFVCENFPTPPPRQKHNGPSLRANCLSPTAQAGEVEVTEVVLIGALRTDNMKSPVLNPLNVLLGLS